MCLLSSLNLIFDGNIIRLSYTKNLGFQPPFRRYKRLWFVICIGDLSYVTQEVLQGIPGARNISDDIIVFGKTQEAHDEHESTISCLAERGLTLNRIKVNDSVFTKNEDVANVFNTYFAEIGENLSNQIPQTNVCIDEFIEPVSA